MSRVNDFGEREVEEGEEEASDAPFKFNTVCTWKGGSNSRMAAANVAVVVVVVVVVVIVPPASSSTATTSASVDGLGGLGRVTG